MAYDTWEFDTIPFSPTSTTSPSTMSAKEVYFIDRGTNFYLYNYATQTWSIKANPPADANRLAGGIVRGGKVYFPGVKKIHIYDIAGNSWSASADSPAAVITLRAMCFEDDDTIWCYGSDASVFDKVAKYVISTNTWTEGERDTSGYHVAWCVLFKSGKLYAGTNDGVRSYDVVAETFALVDAAAGREFMAGHDPDVLGYYDGSDDYGYWQYSDLTLYDAVLPADSITAGYLRYAGMSPDHLDAVAWVSGTDLAIYETSPPAPSSVGGFNPALAELIL